MKYSLLLFSVLLILCIKITEAQTPTYASLPDSSHVLVVFNSLDQTSIAVKDYYKLRRGIPQINIVGLEDLINDVIYDSVSNTTHSIELTQQGEIIRDMNNANSQTPSIHAWIYFNERIAKPIADWLTTHEVNGVLLKDIIRFIVLCKGVPFRIDARQEDADSKMQNVICANLLTLLGETMEDEDALLFYYDKQTSVPNPYFYIDPNFSMDHNFLPNHYETTVNIGGQARNISLSYLVTHLSAPRLQDVDSMINRSIRAINETNYDWFIDSDPTPCMGWLILPIGNNETIFSNLGIANYFFDNTEDTITSYGNRIMSYSSYGIWTSIGTGCTNMPFNPDYIQTQLNFTHAAGAFFNTIESHNGLSIGTYPVIRTRQQGLIADFTLMGGTVAVGQAFHSPGSYVIPNEIYFPNYAMGYTFIEAAYLGIQYLNATNVIVGDPLTRIAYPCEPTIISSNTTITSGDYDCDIIVQEGAILTITGTDNLPVNFKRNAGLIVEGSLIISAGTELNFDDYSELRLEEGYGLDIEENTTINFKDYSFFTINDNFVFYDNIPFTFEDWSSIVINGTAVLSENSTLNFVDYMICRIYGDLTLNNNATLNLLNNASMRVNTNGKLKLNNGSNLNVYNLSKFFSYGELNLSEGVNLNLQNPFELSGIIKSIGSENNPVVINCLSSFQLSFKDVDTLILQYTTIESASILVVISDGVQKPRLLSVSNSSVNNSQMVNAFGVISTDGVDITLSDNFFSTGNQNNFGLLFYGFNNVQMVRNIIQCSGAPGYPNGTGIWVFNNKTTEINNCEINSFSNGIKQSNLGLAELEEIEPTNNEDVQVYNCTLDGDQDNPGAGISIGFGNTQVSAVKIDINNISNFETGIIINNSDDFPLQIKNNTITSYELFGISLSNGSEGVIKENIITANESTTEQCIGISVNQVTYPSIIDNTITAQGVTAPGSGIFSVSSNGEIRNNTIQHHWFGVELGSSSPNIGANTITDNLRYGIYINDHSYPDLSEQIVGGDPYPLSGYNTIRENGECNFLPSYSELYLRFNSTVNLEKGCNTIADDREDPALHCNYLYLINGSHVAGEVNAVRNYWGEVNRSNPEGRFGGGLIVDYKDWQLEPCTYDEGGGILILANSKGEVYDTVYTSGEMPSALTDIELRYASANEYYYDNQYTQAKQEYQSIIEDYGDSTESLQAYNRLYSLSNLMNSSPGTFNQLKDYYLQKASNQTDSIMIETLTHLSDLCLVSATEYVTAINNFDEEAQQNPNTDIAMYRQIDALTTALLLPQDSTMNKGMLGKYSVNDLSDYTNKLSELIKTRGKSGLETEEETLPTEYTLYQNYPNPFNPATIIKYDLPNTSDVSLIIYDILGRKVKELVNTRQQAGRYEVQFNASNLASGVYIYQLIADRYVNAKKMILLK